MCGSIAAQDCNVLCIRGLQVKRVEIAETHARHEARLRLHMRCNTACLFVVETFMRFKSSKPGRGDLFQVDVVFGCRTICSAPLRSCKVRGS
jgi:hypothetical protein